MFLFNLLLEKPEACNFIKKEILAQVFFCKFCKISKNTFFTEHLWWLLLDFKWLVKMQSKFKTCKAFISQSEIHVKVLCINKLSPKTNFH